MQVNSMFKKSLVAAAALASVAATPIVTAQDASAFGRGGYGGRGIYLPHGGGFGHGGFGRGAYAGGYGGGWHGGGYGGGWRGGYHRGYGGGFGYGLAGFGLGLGLGAAYGGYPYGTYAGYGGYDYDYPVGSCLRRVYGYYGPHWVRVC